MPSPIRIGLVFDHSNDYCRNVLFGIKRYAETKPHWVLLSVVPERDRLENLRKQRVKGMIGHVYKQRLYEILKSLRKPMVNVSSVVELPVPRVATDDVASGRIAAEYFIERGFQHFGCISHRHYAYAIRQEAGYCDTVEAAGRKVYRFYDPLMRTFHVRGTLYGIDKRVHAWLLSLPKPVAIFASNDNWGYELAEACRLVGLRVPEDVSLLGVDNDNLMCELARPALSSVAIPGEQIGYEAAALLDRMLDGARRPRRPLLLPPLGVVTRQSTDILAVDDPELASAISFIRQHSHLPIRVSDVLRHVPTTRRSLERRFRQVLQRGISEEIRRVHLAKAKSLLAFTRISVADVARQAGFSGNKHLSVVFRQELGMTPSDYRGQFQSPPGDR